MLFRSNEVVVPTAVKDQWNRSAPVNDKQYAGPVLTPILAKLMNDLYKVNAPTTNRDDLVAVFGTGVKGLNFTGDTVADLLRLNYSIPVTPADKVNRLGVIGGDNGGFPNGRRLGDDVVDAAERVMAGFLKGNKVELGDGVNAGDVPNLGSFPCVVSGCWTGLSLSSQSFQNAIEQSAVREDRSKRDRILNLFWEKRIPRAKSEEPTDGQTENLKTNAANNHAPRACTNEQGKQ